MGSSQSILSKEDMEAYKQLTYFTEAEIKNCLQKFSELLDPNTPFKSVHDPEASIPPSPNSKPYKSIHCCSGEGSAWERGQRNARVEGLLPVLYKAKSGWSFPNQQCLILMKGEPVCKADLSSVLAQRRPADDFRGVPRHALFSQVQTCSPPSRSNMI